MHPNMGRLAKVCFAYILVGGNITEDPKNKQTNQKQK